MFINKGLQGYLKNRKIITTVRTAFLFVLSIGIYFAGYYFLKTNKSVITVIAILGVLPAAKSAVNMIMFLRFPSIGEEDCKEYNNKTGKLPALYEMVFTTYDKSYYVPALVCYDKTICGYCNVKDTEIKKLEKHLTESLIKAEHKNVSVKIFSDKKSYLDRLSNMNEHFFGSYSDMNNETDNSDKEKVDRSTEAVFNTLKAIAL